MLKYIIIYLKNLEDKSVLINLSDFKKVLFLITGFIQEQ